MPTRILVPLDGSVLAASALAHAIAAAPSQEVQITLLRVIERRPAMAGADPFDWHLQRSEAQAYLDQVRDSLRKCVACPPDTVLLEGNAADRIIEHAHSGGYDLMVFTSHGRGGLTGWSLSSVASKLAVRARLPILLVRPLADAATPPAEGLQPARYRRILVPLDGSQRAEHVLPAAGALAEQHGADLLLLHVVAKPEMLQRMPLSQEDAMLAEQVVERNRRAAEEYFEQLEPRLTVRPQTHVLVEDNVDTAAHHFATEHEADLVVLSAHGYSGHSQWPYGSLTTSFLTYGTTHLFVLQDMPWQSDAAASLTAAARNWQEEGLRGAQAPAALTPGALGEFGLTHDRIAN